MNGARIVCLMTTFVLSASAVGAGTVVSGNVDGTWDLAGSPYWVEGNLIVQAGTTLTIEPGVQVRFRGAYPLLVNGTLHAAGVESDSILFTRDDPIVAHEWHGIDFVGAEDASKVAYARVEYVRAPDAYPEVRGGAIYCESCSPSIRHCLLQRNRSHNANQNGMGGGVACITSSALIEFCVIRDNYADSGGGICTLEDGFAVIRNNLITANIAPYCGGGIYAGVRSSPIIENNIIVDNTAHGWGGGGITLWNWYSAFGRSKTVRNNYVAENSTSAVGGGFYIRYDYSVLDNNTVVNNTASGGGGGLYVLNQGYGDFPPDVRNVIIWGNTGGGHPSIYLEPSTGSAVYVSYSDVEGGWAGTGNISDPPLLEGAGYNLETGSPCIDAGDPTAAYDDACFPPSQGSTRNDMGATGGPMACGWPDDGPVSVDGSVGIDIGCLFVHVTPNPVRSQAMIEYAVATDGRVSLRLHDAAGRIVRNLFEPERKAAGRYSVSWDGRDAMGRPVAAGTYFYRLQGGGHSRTGKITVLR